MRAGFAGLSSCWNTNRPTCSPWRTPCTQPVRKCMPPNTRASTASADACDRLVNVLVMPAAVKQALRTDAEAEPAALRCRVHARLFVWNPLFAGHGDAAEYERWCREFGCDVPLARFRPAVEV